VRATFCAKPFAKYPAQGAPGVIGADGKIKGRVHLQLFEQRGETRYAFAGSTQGIHIDLEADVRVFKHRATTRRRPRARRGRRESNIAFNAVRMSVFGVQPSSAVVFLIEGRRAGMSA